MSTSSVRAALITVLAADAVDAPAHLTAEQIDLVGGYLLPSGRLDPREAVEARAHLRRLGGPSLA